MAGNKVGGRKTADKNLASDPDFYRKIGSQSWKDPERNRKTGFARLSREKLIELSRKGGSKTKDDYQSILGPTKVGDRFKVAGQEYEIALVEEYETVESLKEIFHPEDEDQAIVRPGAR